MSPAPKVNSTDAKQTIGKESVLHCIKIFLNRTLSFEVKNEPQGHGLCRACRSDGSRDN